MAFFKKNTKKADNKDVKVEHKPKNNEVTTEKKQSMKELYSGNNTVKTVKKSKKIKKIEKSEVAVKKDVEKVEKIALKKKDKYGSAFRVLVRPLITEKISNLSELNKYAFEVYLDANKIEIAKAINEVYGVMPTKVNIIRMKGKVVRVGKIKGRRKKWKKAIITLSKGENINIYEGI